MRFQDNVVVVTGASKGIGEAAAVAFAREGAHVVIASLNEQDGANTARSLQQDGHDALFVQTDVAREDQVQALFRTVEEKWGRLDVLVNNAGIYRQGDVTQTSLADWQQIIGINLTGAFLCTKYAVPIMQKQKRGVIINVSSEAGLVGIGGQVAYNVSKTGMISLTQSCAIDLAPDGIRVNCVCPGTTDTPLVRDAVQRAPDPAAARQHLESIRPLNRLGTSEEIAAAILFMASEGAAYATGSVLAMDGGYTAQ